MASGLIALRVSGPHARDRIVAEVTFSVLYVCFFDRVPSSLDADVETLGAVRIFRFVSGYISDVDIIDPLFTGGISCFF